MIVSIEMMNNKEEWVTEEFNLKKYGTPFQYERDLNNIASNSKSEFEGVLALAIKYLPNVIGKDRFMLDGLDSNIKFSEVIEEFFINDTTALGELMTEVGFFLSPALKRRYGKAE